MDNKDKPAHPVSDEYIPDYRADIRYELGFVQGLRRGYRMGERGEEGAMLDLRNARQRDIQELRRLAKASTVYPPELVRDAINSAKEVLQDYRMYIEDSGPCDHAVNICVCGMECRADDLDKRIAALQEVVSK